MLNRKTLFGFVLVFIVFSATLLPAVQAKPAAKDKRLQAMLEMGFRKYLRDLGLKESQLDEEAANSLFQQFLKDKPEYQEYVREYDEITNRKEKQPMSVPNLDVSKVVLGRVLNEFNTTVNGATYEVVLAEGWLPDGSKVAKATFYGPEGIVDPWIYVRINYLKFWILWWQVTYGEDQWFYTYYVTNAGGVNEAAIFKAKFEEWSIYMTTLWALLGVVLGALTAEVGGIGAIVGVVGAYQAMWANYVVANAYSSSRGLKVCLFNHYLYTILGSAMVLRAWWWIDYSWHRAIPAPGLELFALTTTQSWIISQAMHAIGDRYGYKRWVWVGVYRG